MLRIVVTEYPKSGGSWVTSMLGDALSLPKRDIYIGDDYKAFNIRKHPWYVGQTRLGLTESCVIKSHELPNSKLIDFPAVFLHLVRDGRDVVVSRYFYEKDFCVNNGLRHRFDVPFQKFVTQAAAEWDAYVTSWLDATRDYYKYEDFILNPFDTLKKILKLLKVDVSDSQISYAIENNTKERFKAALDATVEYNTFVRKATSGDWVNHFKAADEKAFKKIAGKTLVRLGYESSLNWQNSGEGVLARREKRGDRKWPKWIDWPGRKDR